jgi:site-specific recombinase
VLAILVKLGVAHVAKSMRDIHRIAVSSLVAWILVATAVQFVMGGFYYVVSSFALALWTMAEYILRVKSPEEERNTSPLWYHLGVFAGVSPDADRPAKKK